MAQPQLHEPSPAVLAEFLLAWSGRWQRESSVAGSVRAWNLWLATGDGAKIFQRVFREDLPHRLAFIRQVCESVTGRAAADLSPSACQWCLWASQLTSRSASGDSSEWRSLFCADELAGNALLHATLARSLAESLERSGFPREKLADLAPLLKWHLGRCGDAHLPPSPGYSWSLGDYMLLAPSAATATLTEDVAAMLQSLRDLKARWSRVATLLKSDSLPVHLSRLELDIGQLTDLLRNGWAGLPVLASELRNHTEKLTSRATELLSGGSPLSDARSLVGSRVTKVVDSCETLLQQQRNPRTAPLPVDGVVAAEPSCLADRLHRVILGVRADPSPMAQEFGDRLGGILIELDFERLGAGSREGHEQLIRQCLGCLVTLDAMGMGGKAERWVERARTELREIVVEEGTYVVLDSELLGMPVQRCSERVEVVGFTPSGSFRAGQIAEVCQVGYALRSGGGGLKTLHRAKVLVVDPASDS